MNKKIIGVLALCVIGLAIVSYQLWNQEPEPVVVKEAESKAAPTKAAEKVKHETEKPSKVPAQQTIQPSIQHIEPQVTTEEKESDADPTFCEKVHQYDDWYPQGDSYESQKFMDEAKEWAFARGYFETEYSQGDFGIKKQSDYDFYAIEDLEEMAQAGDSMANVRLAYRLYLKGDNDSMAKAQPYCDRAVADGYTALIMCKAAPLISEIYEEQRKESPDKEKIRQLELDFKAWQNTASELGDPLAERLGKASLSQIKTDFEPEDVKAAAQNKLASIRQKRQQLGLGPMQHPPMPDLLAYALEEDIDNGDDLNACFE